LGTLDSIEVGNGIVTGGTRVEALETGMGILGDAAACGMDGGENGGRGGASISPCRLRTCRGGFFTPAIGTAGPAAADGIEASAVLDSTGMKGGGDIFGSPDETDTCRLIRFRNPDPPGSGVKMELTGTGILGTPDESHGVGSGVMFGKPGLSSVLDGPLGPTVPSRYCAMAVPATRRNQLHHHKIVSYSL
jgi:hypothetical protein